MCHLRAVVGRKKLHATKNYSSPLFMVLAQSLSILTNFLASIGICLAISPPMNTDSRLVHRSCTLIHSSRLSVALLSSFSLLYRLDRRRECNGKRRAWGWGGGATHMRRTSRHTRGFVDFVPFFATRRQVQLRYQSATISLRRTIPPTRLKHQKSWREPGKSRLTWVVPNQKPCVLSSWTMACT